MRRLPFLLTALLTIGLGGVVAMSTTIPRTNVTEVSDNDNVWALPLFVMPQADEAIRQIDKKKLWKYSTSVNTDVVNAENTEIVPTEQSWRFVGIAQQGRIRYAIIALETEIKRFREGDILVYGQRLVNIKDNSIVVQQGQQQSIAYYLYQH